VDVKIGVTNTPREVSLELADDTDRVALRAQIEEGIASGGVLWFVDIKGREVALPAEKIAYFEMSPASEKRIGFAV
jgi:Protein of unknown function (DUF3107)